MSYTSQRKSTRKANFFLAAATPSLLLALLVGLVCLASWPDASDAIATINIWKHRYPFYGGYGYYPYWGGYGGYGGGYGGISIGGGYGRR